MKCVIYNAQGRILRLVEAPVNMLSIQAQPGEYWLIGYADDRTQYIDQGEILYRPVHPIAIDKTEFFADGEDRVNFFGAELGSVIKIERIDQFGLADPKASVSGEIDGTDSFSTMIPGTYCITIERWPFLDWSAMINAV